MVRNHKFHTYLVSAALENAYDTCNGTVESLATDGDVTKMTRDFLDIRNNGKKAFVIRAEPRAATLRTSSKLAFIAHRPENEPVEMTAHSFR